MITGMGICRFKFAFSDAVDHSGLATIGQCECRGPDVPRAPWGTPAARSTWRLWATGSYRFAPTQWQEPKDDARLAKA